MKKLNILVQLIILVCLSLFSLNYFGQSSIQLSPTGWRVAGNTVGNNTSFLGSLDNRSLLFKTNNLQRMKLDSNGVFTWSISANSNFILRAHPTASNTSAIYMGTSVQTSSNYFIYNDGSTVLLNMPNDSSIFTVTKNNGSYFANFRGDKSNSSSATVDFRSSARPNITAAANCRVWTFTHHQPTIWKSGTIPEQQGFFTAAQTCAALGTSSITNYYAAYFTKAIEGTSMTINNNWGIGTDGSAAITQSILIGTSARNPVAVLDVTGTTSVSSTSTLNGLVLPVGTPTPGYVWTATNTGGAGTWSASPGGGSSAPTDEIVYGTGSGITSSNALKFNSSGNPEVSIINSGIGNATYNLQNVFGASSFQQSGTDLYTSSSGVIIFRPTNVEKFRVTSSGVIITGNLTDANAVINTSAGDAATINAISGRFRKDQTGSTFTLTNSFITANSIIVCQIVTTGITTGYLVRPAAGSGSAVITFETAGVAAAPSADCDVNFWITN